MIKRLPIIPTIIVVAAAAVMVWLGFWQLGRAEEKAQLIAQFSESSSLQEEVAFPILGEGNNLWFRRSSINCIGVSSVEAVSGTAANGAKGWAHRATCKTAETPDHQIVTVDLGFTRNLTDIDWEGGVVSGVIAPGPRLVADPPTAGLEPLAKPDPNDLPNNHMAYVGQWFFFALTALVIYWFAVRSRLAKRD